MIYFPVQWYLPMTMTSKLQALQAMFHAIHRYDAADLVASYIFWQSWSIWFRKDTKICIYIYIYVLSPWYPHDFVWKWYMVPKPPYSWENDDSPADWGSHIFSTHLVENSWEFRTYHGGFWRGDELFMDSWTLFFCIFFVHHQQVH